jgi:hypothetical protein
MSGASQAAARRAKHADWLRRYELVAEVTRSEHCANFIKAGETFVFDLNGILLPAKSTGALCLGILARLQPALLIAKDRAHEGLHPVSPGWQTFDCFDTGLDHGGMGKVAVRFHLRDAATGARVADASADAAADARR